VYNIELHFLIQQTV